MEQVHCTHLQACLLAALQMRVYFEWVPSEANTSDLPSRALEAGAMEKYFDLLPYIRAWAMQHATARRVDAIRCCVPGSVFAMYGAWVSAQRDDMEE